MAEHDDAKQKQELVAGKGGTFAPATTKIWRTINRPNAAAAVAYLNLAPAQQAGEAFVGCGPTGTVDVYAFF